MESYAISSPFFFAVSILLCIFAHKNIKRIQYEEAFPIHDIDGAAVGG